MFEEPVVDKHYPGSLPAVRGWFDSDADCLDYLDWLRWPDGFVCPWCAGVSDWSSTPGVHRCGDCGRRVSVTAGTIFHKTRTPLSVWFEAAWLFTASKQGLSALELQRVTGLGSYQTAWTMLHRFRVAMTSTGRAKLTGRVEVDESFIGAADQPGAFGRSGIGKVLIAAAVERPTSRSYGRIRLQVVENASIASLQPFLADTVEPGATVLTDGLPTYRPITAALGMGHEPVSVAASGKHAHEMLPGVHLVFSLLKRVLDTTYQGAVAEEHLQAYLDEYVFRFNRRMAKQRGLLFLRLLEHAVAAGPVTYRDLAVSDSTGLAPVLPLKGPRRRPASLAQDPARRPWRAA